MMAIQMVYVWSISMYIMAWYGPGDKGKLANSLHILYTLYVVRDKCFFKYPSKEKVKVSHESVW